MNDELMTNLETALNEKNETTPMLLVAVYCTIDLLLLLP